MRPVSTRPRVCPGSPERRDSRIHNTSIGAPRSRTSRPARSRSVEWRPSAATTRSAFTLISPPGVVASNPVTSLFSTVRSRASASIFSWKAGNRLPWSARKSRKSHCGIKAMNRQWVGKCVKSATSTKSSPICAPRVRTSWCGRRRNSSSRPSSYMTSSVEGWIVSPRKSRRKSACFSRTRTEISGSGKQETEHHAGRAAAGDAAADRNLGIHDDISCLPRPHAAPDPTGYGPGGAGIAC